jgi:hypothetical protein
MDISILATSEREVFHEIKKWMPDLVIIDPQSLVRQAKAIAEKFLESQLSKRGKDSKFNKSKKVF